MKATKGPWKVGDKIKSIVLCETGDAVCACLGPVPNGSAEGNAQLIAASQDLLEAAKAMHHGMDVLFAMLIEKDSNFFPSKSPVWDAIVKGNDAIKKAEGN